MATDETIARLKALSDRLDRIRRQAQEVYNVAADEGRVAYTNRDQRETPTVTERRAVRRR